MTPPGLWFRFHVNAHEHPKVIRLRSLAGRHADAACWGWFGHVLAGAKRYGSWTFADQSHLEHVAGPYAKYLDLYREVGLLDGLTVHDGEAYNAPKDPTAAERMRRYRSQRDGGDERNDRNAVTPRAEQNRTEQSVSVARAWEDASGRTLLGSGNYAFGYIEDAIRRHGDAKVVEAIGRARATFPHVPETNALAAAVKRFLDPLPDGKVLAAQEREAERERASSNRSLATLVGLHWQHAEPHPRCPRCQQGDAA